MAKDIAKTHLFLNFAHHFPMLAALYDESSSGDFTMGCVRFDGFACGRSTELGEISGRFRYVSFEEKWVAHGK